MLWFSKISPGVFSNANSTCWHFHTSYLRRAGARVGQVVAVSGTIGDGALGLAAGRGEIADPDGFLAGRLRLPTPRLDLRGALRDRASGRR